MFRGTTVTTTKPLFAEQANYSDSLARRIKNKKSQKTGLTLELMCKEYSLFIYGSESVSCSIMSNSLQPHGLYPARLLYPWDFPGKNTGVGYYFLLQGIFPTQG